MSKFMSETYFSADYGQAPAKATAGTFISALADNIRRCLHTLEQWNDRAAQRRSLLELDDRMLTDIGIGRADAWTEGTKPFWRD